MAGKKAEAQQVLDHLDELSKHQYVAPYNFALIHFGLGNEAAGFAWLERAYVARSYLLAVYLNTDARLGDIYGDPRYEDLRRRMKLPTPLH